MANSTTMTYDSYSFSPVPFIDITERRIVDKQGSVGKEYRIRVDGTLSTRPTQEGGYTNVDTLQDALRDALSVDGRKLDIKCGDTHLLTCYPRLEGDINFTRTNDNWVYTTKYDFTFVFADFHGNDNAPYLESREENWQVEFLDEQSPYDIDLSSVSNQEAGYTYASNDSNPYFLRVTHNVNAAGMTHYSESGTTPGGTGVTGYLEKQAWEYARDWVIDQLGIKTGVIQDSGVLNLDLTNYGAYNHIRVANRNETDGRYSASETWLVAISGSGFSGNLDAMESFNVEVANSIDTDLTTVSVNGQIQGLETRDYGTNPGDFSITKTKMAAAEAQWSATKLKILPRAQYYGSGANRSINVEPNTEVIGRSLNNGTINYSYSFDDRPSNCISGAKTENIVISDTNAVDIVATLPVLGRLAGPVLQDVGTVGPTVRNVSIECIMQPHTGSSCSIANLNSTKPTGTNQVPTLLCTFETDLTGTYNQVFKVEDTENWEPKTGRYSRNVSWLYQDCTATGITSVC